MTISNEAVEKAADLIVQGNTDYCECRRSPFDKHTVNPPCSTRRDAMRVARVVLEAAAGIIRAECLEEAAAAWDTRSVTFLETMKGMAESREYTHEDIIRYGAYSAEAQTTAARLRARAVAERGRQ